MTQSSKQPDNGKEKADLPVEKWVPVIASAKAVGPYSIAAATAKNGGIMFMSGQIALKDGQLVEGGIEEQTRQVTANIDAILKELGLTAANVLKTTVFLTEMGDFEKMNGVYASYFGEDEAPARSTVAVKALPKGALVEIECIVRT